MSQRDNPVPHSIKNSLRFNLSQPAETLRPFNVSVRQRESFNISITLIIVFVFFFVIISSAFLSLSMAHGDDMR